MNKLDITSLNQDFHLHISKQVDFSFGHLKLLIVKVINN